MPALSRCRKSMLSKGKGDSEAYVLMIVNFMLKGNYMICIIF